MSVDDQLSAILRQLFGDVEVTDTTTAADIDGWDSLAHINLMFMIEYTFDIEFADNEFASFENVGALRRAVESKIAA